MAKCIVDCVSSEQSGPSRSLASDDITPLGESAFSAEGEKLLQLRSNSRH